MKLRKLKRQFNIIITAMVLSAGCIACGGDTPGPEPTEIVIDSTSSDRVEDDNDKNNDKSGLAGAISDNSISANSVSGDSVSANTASGTDITVIEDDKQAGASSVTSTISSNDIKDENIVYRDSTPRVYVPSCPGTKVAGNELVTIDYSNDAEGYIGVQYKGSNGKVKLQLTGPDGTTYTYDLTGGADIIPITAGSGAYNIGCYENVSGSEYAIAYTDVISLTVSNSFGPYLYPNLYVNFNSASKTVAKGQELASTATCELDVVSNVYTFVVNNYTYDYNLASTVNSGYIPVVDSVLDKGSGICFDYAELMAVMLRSQGIPTRLEVGYAGSAYHAWISTYISETGWVDGIIQFNGSSWTLMDPTFAANSDREAFKEFIGNGNNYMTIYKY